jgi:hypothetical protein
LQEAGEIRGGGNTVAGPDLFGDRTAAQQLAALQDEDLAAGARQIRRGDQPPTMMAS